jgi:hypothetical protein
MVTKSALKMALAAEKGTDFKKLKLNKKEKAARKKNAQKGGAGREEKANGKKVEEEWEDVDGEDESEDGGAAVNEDESGSEEEVDRPMKVCSSGQFNRHCLTSFRLTSQPSTKAIATHQLVKTIKITSQTMKTKRTFPCLISKTSTMKKRKT